MCWLVGVGVLMVLRLRNDNAADCSLGELIELMVDYRCFTSVTSLNGDFLHLQNLCRIDGSMNDDYPVLLDDKQQTEVRDDIVSRPEFNILLSLGCGFFATPCRR
jgi:hypothetical protein